MKHVVLALAISCIVMLLLTSGCADVAVQEKVGDFGTAFGYSSDELKAIDWFKSTYGDPMTNNDQPSRFIEPLITTGLDKNNLPTNKVTTFPVINTSVYFFVIYDNFMKGDLITVRWVYRENGREVTRVEKQAGGDFGRFIVEFQKPDSGWGKGWQQITVSGNGALSSVNFVIGDVLQTTALPYNPSESTSPAGQIGTVFGASSDEQKTIDWFKATYGNPFTNNDQPPRFVEPLITTGLDKNNMPVDKLATFPGNGSSVFFWVIYDNFMKGDPITVSWVYLENGREVLKVQKEAEGDFGRFIAEFQKPDSGWGEGRQKITVSGRGVSANVTFLIGDFFETTTLPYNPDANPTALSPVVMSGRKEPVNPSGKSITHTTMIPLTRTTDPWAPPILVAKGNDVNVSTVVTQKENITAI